MPTDTSLSNSAATVIGGGTKHVKSSYALIAVVLLASLSGTIFAPDFAVRMVFLGVFVIGAAVVLWRYQQKGPEAERTPPAFSLTAGQLIVQGFDASLNPELSKELGALVERFRRPLPPPAGIVEGLASGGVTRPASPDELAQLSTQGLIAPVGQPQIEGK
jgi:hypothetical protein